MRTIKLLGLAAIAAIAATAFAGAAPAAAETQAVICTVEAENCPGNVYEGELAASVEIGEGTSVEFDFGSLGTVACHEADLAASGSEGALATVTTLGFENCTQFCGVEALNSPTPPNSP